MVRLYIATQKPLDVSAIENYVPLTVGKAENGDEFNDATGDSIFERNRFYCELTGHYWIWKNDRQSDIVGLMQYRRFLWLNRAPRMICRKEFASLADCRELLDTRQLSTLLDNHDIILPRPYAFSRDTLETQFCRFHRRENFALLLDAIRKTHPEFLKSVEETFNRRTAYLANLLIARKETFDEYSRKLFDVLFEVERQIDLNNQNARMLGYMGERFLNLYVDHNRLRVKEVPLIFISNAEKLETSRIDLRYIKRRYFPSLLTIEQTIRNEECGIRN